VSAAYMLRTAFEHEIRNHLEIRIAAITDGDHDLTEEESDELKKLSLLRDYLIQRIGELGKGLP